MKRSQSGFTLPELIAVMIILAVLTVSATGMMDRKAFDAADYANQVRAQLAYAQKVAVAARRVVIATVAGNAVSLSMCEDPACSNSVPVASPQGESSFVRSGTPKNISIGPPVVISFDAQGVPSTGVTLVVSGGGTHSITVEAGTGYVH